MSVGHFLVCVRSFLFLSFFMFLLCYLFVFVKVTKQHILARQPGRIGRRACFQPGVEFSILAPGRNSRTETKSDQDFYVELVLYSGNIAAAGAVDRELAGGIYEKMCCLLYF